MNRNINQYRRDSLSLLAAVLQTITVEILPPELDDSANTRGALRSVLVGRRGFFCRIVDRVEHQQQPSFTGARNGRRAVQQP